MIIGEVTAETWTRVLIPFVACMLVRGTDFQERFNQRFPPMPELNQILSPDNANRARLRELQRLLTCVLAAKWIVLTTHGKGSLITNDLGYAPFANPAMGHRGLAIPLGQRSILAIIPSMEDRPILYNSSQTWTPIIEYRDLPAGNHQGLNRAMAHWALRFVYGPNKQTVDNYFLGIPELPSSPEPLDLGFPDELLMPTFEFTWHRLVSSIQKSPSDSEGWDFALDWDAITSSWYSTPYFPGNLIEFPPALKRVDNTIQLKFYDGAIYYEISRILIYQEEGKNEDVVETATTALTYNLSPSLRASILSRRGGAFVELGKTNEAIKDYEDACKIAPSNENIYIDYGYTLIKAEHYAKAYDVLSTAIRLNPKSVAAHLNRGAALWRLGRLKTALADVEFARDHASNVEEKANAHLSLGNIHVDLGDFAKAAESYQIASSFHAELTIKVMCLSRQAWALAMIKQFDRALEVYNQTLELDPKDLDALKGRSLLYWTLGDQTKAMEDRDKALQHALDEETKRGIKKVLDFRTGKRYPPSLYFLFVVIILFLIYALVLLITRR